VGYSMKEHRFDPADFVEIRSPDEIYSRPDYQADIDPTASKPEKIIAGYQFPEAIPCGLKNCHQPHKQGYLVLTTSGAETNMGWVCGVNHFGVDFRMMRKSFDRAASMHRYKLRLQEILGNADDILSRWNGLVNEAHGLRWLQQSMRWFSRTYPPSVVAMVRDRSRRGDAVVSVERERSKQQLDAAEVANPGVSRERLRYIAEPVGQLQGLSIFEKDLYAHEAYKVENGLQELRGLDLESLSYRKLGDLYRWASTIEDSLLDVELLLEEGQKFFQAENLGLLGYLARHVPDQDLISRIDWDYDAANCEVKSPKKTKAWKRMMAAWSGTDGTE
jgi:hypothetical protein